MSLCLHFTTLLYFTCSFLCTGWWWWGRGASRPQRWQDLRWKNGRSPLEFPWKNVDFIGTMESTGTVSPRAARRAYHRTWLLNNIAVNLQIVPHLLSRFLCLLLVAARPFHIWMIPFLLLRLKLAAVYGLLGIWLCLFWIGFLKVVLTALSTWATNTRKFPKSRALL